MNDLVPLIIEFKAGSKLQTEDSVEAELPSFQIPTRVPEMAVVMPDGQKIELPSEQVVMNEENQDGSVRVGFGGMSFEGAENENLVFWRVRDLMPEEIFFPERDDKVLIHTDCIEGVVVQGIRVWPRIEPVAASGADQQSTA